MNNNREPKLVPVSLIRWAVGIFLTVFMFAGSGFYAFTSEAGERDTEIKVLQARIESLETAAARADRSAIEIASAVSEMQTSQAAFQAEMRASINYFKEELRDR